MRSFSVRQNACFSPFMSIPLPSSNRCACSSCSWISFTGIVTFANAREVAAASDLVPEDRIMVETDAPFLTPEPHRTVRPNEPRYVGCVAEFLARRRGVAPEAFEAILDRNAERFFGISIPD